jgi:hypothetical protein
MSIAGSFKQQIKSLVRGFGGRTRPAGTASRRAFVGVEALEERVQMAATPGTPLLPDLLPLASKPKAYLYGWQIDRAEKPGRTLLRLTSAIANAGQGPFEIRSGPVVDGAQQVIQRVNNSDGTHTDRIAGNFTYHPQHHHTHFDHFAQYRIRQLTPNNGVGKVVRTGKKVSFCLTDSDQFDKTLPNASANGNYYSCSARRQGISVGWADVYGQSLPDQWVDITKLKAGKYWLEVAVDPDNRVLESNETNNTVRIKVSIQAQVKPRNDDFEQRTVVSGAAASVRGSNANASKQQGEPEHETIGGTSVWYSWTAPSSGAFSISTAGSEIDTLLTVYTGTTLTDLTRVAGNDDDKTDRTSKVTIQAKAGTTYQIAVDGYRGASGNVKLNITAGK